jgi:hypothetical protein
MYVMTAAPVDLPHTLAGALPETEATPVAELLHVPPAVRSLTVMH